jgi:hypothetical protein
MIEHGIIVGGAVLPGTERVLRDSDAWWEEPSDDVYPRRGYRIDRIVGHWSAGNAHTGPNAGRKLYRAMLARRKDSNGDGKLTPDDEFMDVSCHFGIGWDGLIWQLADLQSATIHVARRINLRSVGVECMWPGTMRQAAKLGMPAAHAVMGQARGQRIECYPPSDELIEAWRWLAEALASAQHPLLDIDRQRGSMTRPGVMEHCDIEGPKQTKVDAAGLLIGALGWPR